MSPLALFTIWLAFSLLLNSHLSYIGTSRLPLSNTSPQMKSPGYWIDEIRDPDEIILQPQEIQRFNEDNFSRIDSLDKVLQTPEEISGSKIRSIMENSLTQAQEKRRYDQKNRVLGKSFYRKIQKKLNLDGITDKVKVRFGLVVRRTSIRAFPTDQLAMSHPRDYEFNMFQYTAIKANKPVALLSVTRDGQWGYIKSYFCWGWVPLGDIAIARDKKEISNYLNQKPFLVVTGNFIDIYQDAKCTRFRQRAQMGTSISLLSEEEKTYRVLLPQRDKQRYLEFTQAFIRKEEDVHPGYLPYTSRNVINQAFKLLNAPYGWGGMWEERDCSRFILDVFSTFGITFPRNSSQQAKIGQKIALFNKDSSNEERRKALDKAIPGITILQLPGHVMLYLGKENGKYYIIHDIWAYRQPESFFDRIKYLGKVVVSDLSLGEGSARGSLLERLRAIRSIN
jgi:hypothetical protein